MPRSPLASAVGVHLRRFSRDETTVSHAPIMIPAVLVVAVIFANLQSPGEPAAAARETGVKPPTSDRGAITGTSATAVLPVDRNTAE